MKTINRRDFITKTSILASAIPLGFNSINCKRKEDSKQIEIISGVRDFLQRVAHRDGSFRPGIDSNYKGKSDTEYSALAAPTYATIISKTFGWNLPYPSKTIDFLHSCQKIDGVFYAPSGKMDPNSPLAKLYNTVQAVVALRLLGERPKYNPMPVIKNFFKNDNLKQLPLHTTSFFALFFSAWDKKMPKYIDNLIREYIVNQQKDDGFLQNHVAATFHAVHYFRLVGQPTPKATKIVNRVLRDQKNDGSWSLHQPDWDVHACFDALFILRQLADPSNLKVKKAYQKATRWIINCRKPDGGFSHFPGDAPSDVDATYFHVGGLVQTEYLKMTSGLNNKEILGWGHVMDPNVNYSCIK